MKITVSLVGDRAVKARLQAMPDRVRNELRKAVATEGFYLSGYVKERKLSGQVLNVVTGTLRRSITSTVTSSGSKITGTVGTHVIYGRIHELGAMVRRISSKGRAFVAHYPMRAFLRPSLRENVAHIKASFTQAIARALGVKGTF